MWGFYPTAPQSKVASTHVGNMVLGVDATPEYSVGFSSKTPCDHRYHQSPAWSWAAALTADGEIRDHADVRGGRSGEPARLADPMRVIVLGEQPTC